MSTNQILTNQNHLKILTNKRIEKELTNQNHLNQILTNQISQSINVAPFVALRILGQLICLPEYDKIRNLYTSEWGYVSCPVLDTFDGVPMTGYSLSHVIEQIVKTYESRTSASGNPEWFLISCAYCVGLAVLEIKFTRQILDESISLFDWIISKKIGSDEFLIGANRIFSLLRYLDTRDCVQLPVIIGNSYELPLLNTLKISFSATFHSFSYNASKLLPELVNNHNLTIKIFKKEVIEIVDACDYLLKFDIKPNWFRESGSSNIRREIEQVGIKKFLENKPNFDPLQVAYYVKGLTMSINNGLIPTLIRKLLIDLLQDHVESNEIPASIVAAAYGFLSLHVDKLKILKSLGKVAAKVLSSAQDKMTPKGLARVIKVTDDAVFNGFSNMENVNDKDAINTELDQWFSVWGLILSKSDLFFYQEQYESCLAGMAERLANSC